MSIKQISLAALKVGVPGSCIAGSYFLYDRCYPKTFGDWLFWSFDRVPENIEDYHSIFADDEEEIKKEGIENAAALHQWCKVMLHERYELKKRGEYDKFRNFCFKRMKTVRGFLATQKDSSELLRSLTDEEYETMFVVNKNQDDLLEKLPRSHFSNVATINNSEGKAKYRIWCENNLRRKISKIFTEDAMDLILSVYTVCKPLGYSTVEEKLTHDGAEKITDDDEFQRVFQNQKNSDTFLKQINTGKNESDKLSKTTLDSKGKTELKDWCAKSMPRKLTETGVYGEMYNIVKLACTKDALLPNKNLNTGVKAP